MQQASQHHCLLYDGERNAIHEHIVALWKGRVAIPGPDFHSVSVPVFGIDESRFVKARATVAPIENEQLLVLLFDRITREAQNALLKLLEEPAPHTYFVLGVPDREMLLSTVRSRAEYAGRIDGTGASVEDFVRKTPGERVADVRSLAETKDIARIRRFCDALELHLHQELLRAPSPRTRDALTSVLKTRQYLADNSASLKVLLDRIALSI